MSVQIFLLKANEIKSCRCEGWKDSSAHTWWPSTICHLSSKDLMCPWAPGTHIVYIHIFRQNIHTCKIK